MSVHQDIIIAYALYVSSLPLNETKKRQLVVKFTQKMSEIQVCENQCLNHGMIMSKYV